MFKKRKEKKRDPITDEEYRRLVELERQHAPGTAFAAIFLNPVGII